MKITVHKTISIWHHKYLICVTTFKGAISKYLILDFFGYIKLTTYVKSKWILKIHFDIIYKFIFEQNHDMICSIQSNSQ